MNVLIVTNMRPSAQQPYAGIFVVNQAEQLRRTPGITHVTLFTMERTFTGRMGSLVKYARAFARFVPFLFRHYDIVHVHFFYPFILLATAYRWCHPRARVVVTFHGADVTAHIRGSRSRKFYGRLARRADYVIAVSHPLGKAVADKLGRPPDRILCAGIDKNTFYPEEGTAKAYDFIFAGSFTLRKGADLLIEAVRALGRPGLRLCVAGTGPFRDRLLALADACRVTLRERQDQHRLRTLFNQSRFLVLPSRDEPFGLVVTEALYCGTPAVVSRVGGLTEQVREGETGFFTGGPTAADLKAAMETALAVPADRYAAMAAQARRANPSFSLQTVCDETADIYRTLTGTADPAPKPRVP